ncbi:hypothetical protein SAMN05421848_1418 [Kushneria avicenniae]|uniref:Lipopolysaccharide kinase (Kdo/WaaP) family protein n=1 Tax=Kushneria avicenniae TaxID=402385 RepID=A0A1I1J9Z8_9GAMM|nr:hypothetical protein [Kushneria avicenniae]SFC45185.1 hypothetical protein SAMN05421848_1418 [Kushneria avicenniae]
MTISDRQRRCGRPDVLRRQFHGPIRFPGSDWQWWVANEGHALSAARRMDAFLGNDQNDQGVNTLRTFKSRSIYHLHDTTGDCFAKRIPLLTLRKRIGALTGHQNVLLGFDHGSAEVSNTLFLHEHTDYGLPVYCLGEHMRHGLPLQQLLIQPWLGESVGLKTLWQTTTPEYRQRLLPHIEKLLGALYRARLLHLDLHGGNIMIAQENAVSKLHVIDCDKMAVDVAQPQVATALHIGKLLRELEGRRPEHFLQQLSLARHMQRRITGNRDLSEEIDGVLAISLRYRMSKTISRRRLVMSPLNAIDCQALEAQARLTYKNADMPFIDWQRLKDSKSDMEHIVPTLPSY